MKFTASRFQPLNIAALFAGVVFLVSLAVLLWWAFWPGEENTVRKLPGLFMSTAGHSRTNGSIIFISTLYIIANSITGYIIGLVVGYTLKLASSIFTPDHAQKG